MKAISHYTFASFLFVAVLFSLIFMNVISFVMLRKLGRKEEVISAETYSALDYELCYA